VGTPQEVVGSGGGESALTGPSMRGPVVVYASLVFLGVRQLPVNSVAEGPIFIPMDADIKVYFKI
jgi:hypothetical protein